MWTLFVAIVVAIPAGVASNRMDGRLSRWQERRAIKRSEKDKSIRDRVAAAVDHPELVLDDILRAIYWGTSSVLTGVFGIGLLLLVQLDRMEDNDPSDLPRAGTGVLGFLILGVSFGLLVKLARETLNLAWGMTALRRERAEGDEDAPQSE
jgi:hypothetical protein